MVQLEKRKRSTRLVQQYFPEEYQRLLDDSRLYDSSNFVSSVHSDCSFLFILSMLAVDWDRSHPKETDTVHVTRKPINAINLANEMLFIVTDRISFSPITWQNCSFPFSRISISSPVLRGFALPSCTSFHSSSFLLPSACSGWLRLGSALTAAASDGQFRERSRAKYGGQCFSDVV